MEEAIRKHFKTKAIDISRVPITFIEQRDYYWVECKENVQLVHVYWTASKGGYVVEIIHKFESKPIVSDLNDLIGALLKNEASRKAPESDGLESTFRFFRED